jgi:hypothetical protein
MQDSEPSKGRAVVEVGEETSGLTEVVKKPPPRTAPKWELEGRERLKAAIRRFTKPLADLANRDANEGDTRLLVTDFLCDGLGFDKYSDLTTEYQVKGEFADYGVRIDQGPGVLSKCVRCPVRLTRRSGSLTCPTRVASRS